MFTPDIKRVHRFALTFCAASCATLIGCVQPQPEPNAAGDSSSAGGDANQPAPDEQGVDPANEASPNERVAGVWLKTDGALDTLEGYYTLHYLELGVDGYGQAVWRHADSGALRCVPLFFYVNGDALTLQLFYFGDGSALLFEIERPDDDTLKLNELQDLSAAFTRVDAIPDEFTCGGVNFDFEDINLPYVAYNSEPVTDGAFVYIHGQVADLLYPYEVDGLTQQQAFDLNVNGYALGSMQDDDFWVKRSLDYASRYTAAGDLVKEIHLTALGYDFHIRALAWDAAADRLIVHGRDDEERRYSILVVDPANDLVEAEYPNDLYMSSMAFIDGRLFGLSGNNFMYEFDTATMQVVRTYEIWRFDTRWTSLVGVGDRLILLGEIEPHQYPVMVEAALTFNGQPIANGGLPNAGSAPALPVAP